MQNVYNLKQIFLSSLLAFSMAAFSAPAIADDEAEHEEQDEHAEHEGGHHPKNSVAVFLGITKAHEDESTLGFEYARNLNNLWSVGALIERTDRGEETALILGMIELHPTENQRLRFQLGIGRKDPQEEKEDTWRIGIGYEFPLGYSTFIKPYFARDFIDNHEDEDIYGFYFGYLF